VDCVQTFRALHPFENNRLLYLVNVSSGGGGGRRLIGFNNSVGL
jgi:hypothetical protein